MKKNLCLLFSTVVFVLVTSAYSHAATEFVVSRGLQAKETVWLRNKKIQKTDVYMLGYQNSENRWLERAIPKSEFAARVKELKSLRADFAKQQLAHPNPFCRATIRIQEAGKPVGFCADALSAPAQKKLSLWMKAQSELVIGM